MLNIPVRVDYAVRALVDLAQREEGELVPSSGIAKRQSIPEPYLAQLLNTLSRGGLVRSQTGPRGGHALAVSPTRISLGLVVDCIGGKSALVGCLEDPLSCIHVPSCGQREIWQDVEQAVNNILYTTSIADLVRRTHSSRDIHSDNVAQATGQLEV
jgi:Rrf2 family protein